MLDSKLRVVMEISKEREGEVVCIPSSGETIIDVHLEERFKKPLLEVSHESAEKAGAEKPSFFCLVLYCGKNYKALKIKGNTFEDVRAKLRERLLSEN